MPAAAKSKSHKISVKETKDPEFVESYGGSFVASCACGWKSEQRSSEERALRSGDVHLQEQNPVEREPADPEHFAVADNFGLPG